MKDMTKRFSKYGGIAAVVIVVGAILFATLLGKRQGEMPKEYIEANRTLQKLLRGNLEENWFVKSSLDTILPQTQVYVDWTDTSLVVSEQKGKKLTRVPFDKRKDEISCVFLRDTKEGDTVLKTVMTSIFGVPDSVEKAGEMADLIGALGKYVEEIAGKKSVTREDLFLSLLYNSLVGDPKGYVAAGIKDGKLCFVHYDDLPHEAVDVEAFCQTVQNIKQNRIDPAGKSVLSVMVENHAVDTDYVLNVAYFDRRGDIVRGPKGVIVSNQEAERFDRLVNELKSHPGETMLYDAVGDSMRVFDIQALESDGLMLGTVNRTQASTMFMKPKASKAWIVWLVLGFVVGMLAAPAIYGFFHNRKLKKMARNNNDSSAGEAHHPEPVATLPEEVENMSLEQLKEQYAKLYQVAAGLKAEKEQVGSEAAKMGEEREKLVTIAEKQKAELEKNAKAIEELRKDNKENERLLETQKETLKKNKREIEQLNKDLDGCESQIKQLEPKAKWYDALVSCRDEAALLDRLGQMREHSKGKMAQVYALSSLLTNDMKTDIITLKAVVAKIDDATSRQFSPMLDGIHKKSEWYDANYKQVSAESKAYQLLVGTRHTKPSAEDFRAQAAALPLDANDTKWMGQLYTGARQNSQAIVFSEQMWEHFVKEFVSREPLLTDPDSKADKGWYFSMLLNIAYHTADHVRSIMAPNDVILCYNKQFMDDGLDPRSASAKSYEYGNINKSTSHSNLVHDWVSQLGVEHLRVLVDQYAVMP